MLAWLAMLKAGRRLDAGASAVEINAGEIQVAVAEPRCEAGNFGTEPAADVAVGMNRDADLALLDDGMNLNRSEGVCADTDMHLGGRRGIGGDGRRRRSGGSGRRGVEHLVSLKEFGRGSGRGLGRRRGGGRRGSGERSRGISSSGKSGWNVVG